MRRQAAREKWAACAWFRRPEQAKGPSGAPPCVGRPLANTDTIDTGGRPHKVLQLRFGAHASARVIARVAGGENPRISGAALLPVFRSEV